MTCWSNNTQQDSHFVQPYFPTSMLHHNPDTQFRLLDKSSYGMTTAAIIPLASIRELLGVLLINKLLIPQSFGHSSLKMYGNRWNNAFLCMF